MQNLLSQTTRIFYGLTYGACVPRSGHWRSVRGAWLKAHPTCAACGSTKNLEVHHKRPFHLYPKLELDDSNFITLCETMGSEHHLKVGHTINGVSSWKIFNVNVEADAARMLAATKKMKAERPATLSILGWLASIFQPKPSAPSGVLTVMCTIAHVDVHYQARTATVKEYVCYGPTILNVDDDGAGPSQGDPDYQNDTTLHKDGKPLNALVDRWGVVPPQIIRGTVGDMMGCVGRVTRISTGEFVWIVAGDEGPPDKLGEGSQATVKELGDDDNPIRGGDDAHDYIWEWWPGQAAPGYELQAAA